MEDSRHIRTEDIRSMSMAEYAAIRPYLFAERTPLYETDYSYDYWRDMWVETGEIEYLEKMVAKIDE